MHISYIFESALSSKIWKRFIYDCEIPVVSHLQKRRIVDRSCYAPQALQKITWHRSTCNDIIEETSFFNIVINLNM